MAEKGLLLQTGGLLQDGSRLELCLKAWAPCQGAPLRWELRRLLPACGFDLAKRPLHQRLNAQKSDWQQLFEHFLLDWKDHYGDSANAALHKRQRLDDVDVASLEQEYWVSTAGMFVVLLQWSENRRSKEDQERSSLVMRLVLEKCLRAQTSLGMLEIPAEIAQMCSAEPLEGERCACVRRFLAQSAVDEVAWHENILRKLQELFVARKCAALATHMSDVLKVLSLAVDERATEWGEHAWQKGVHAAVPGPTRRRRIDPHVKAWVVQEAVQQGQQQSSSAAANALEPGVGAGQRQWREKEMSCVRAAMHLSFANPQSLSLCWDGMRLGNPAKEYLLECKAFAAAYPGSTEAAAGREGADGVEDTAEAAVFERMPNLHWLRSLDNAFRKGLGVGLSQWMPGRRLQSLSVGAKRYLAEVQPAVGPPCKRSCIEDASGRRYFECPREVVQNKLQRPVLHMVCDLAPIGWPAANFLVQCLGLRGTLVFDLLHRRVCDIEDGRAEAGLRMLKTEYNVVLKMRQGPFQQSGHHSVLKDAAAEMFRETTADNNLLFAVLSDAIAADFQMQSQTQGTEEHTELVWRAAKQLLTKDCKGTNTKTSRWFNFEQNSRAFFPQLHANLLNLLYVGTRRNWWKGYSDCPLNAADLEQCRETQEEAEVRGDGLEALERPPEEADAAAVDAGPSSSRVSTSEAKKVLQQKRAKCVNTLHFSATRLSKPLNIRLWKGMVDLPQPLEVEFHKWMSALKTRRDTQALMLSLAEGGDTEILRQVFEQLLSPEYADNLGFSAEAKNACELEADQTVARCMWKLAYSTVGSCACTDCFFQVPPQKFLGLAALDAEQMQSTMTVLKQFWEALQQLEARALDDMAAKRFIENLLWPSQQWSREVFVQLLEKDFLAANDDIQCEVEAYSKGHWSTLLIENLGNRCRKVSKGETPSGSLGPKSIWHECVLGSTTCEDHDRKAVAVSTAARVAASGKLPLPVFQDKDSECSLSSEDLRKLTASPATWPTPNPANLKLSSLASLLLKETGGDWSRISKAWKSLLLIPGTLVKKVADPRTSLVLLCSCFGALVWDVSMKKEGRRHVLHFGDTGQQSLKFVFVEDEMSWSAVPLKVLTPCSSTVNSDTIDLGKLAVGPAQQKSVKLLLHNASRGFPNLRVEELRKLHTSLGVPFEKGHKPRTEVQLVTALLQHVQPGITSDELESALLGRGKQQTPQEFVKASPVMQNEDLFDIALEDEDSDLQEELRKLKQQALKQQEASLRKRAELRSQLSPDSSRGSSSASAMPPGQPQRPRQNAAVHSGRYDVESARKWAPPQCTLTKEMNWHTRWRVEAPYLGGIKSKSFKKDGPIKDWDALVWVLTLAWRGYTETSGESCPWTFEASQVV
ncbi:unnamed protein product [Symbiodinium sp. CCMP2456]|nr:unnamed protein product [Symbiodinium sp. CCMP2456]